MPKFILNNILQYIRNKHFTWECFEIYKYYTL